MLHCLEPSPRPSSKTSPPYCLSKLNLKARYALLMALDLDAMAFCHLGSGKWPCLKRLDIMNVKRIFSHNEDIELLVHGWYPLLQTLHIGSNSLCYASGVAELIKGHWPLLQSLQVHSELKIEAVSQLVLGTWPLLETLTVTFEDLTEQIVNTVVTGDWPMLKELHINVRGCNLWDRQRVDSWQAIEQGCHDVCRSRWPGLQVANFPDSKALEKRLDRQEQRMSLVNLIQKQAVDSFDSLEELRLKELELKEVELEEFKLEEFELLNNKAYNRL